MQNNLKEGIKKAAFAAFFLEICSGLMENFYK